MYSVVLMAALNTSIAMPDRRGGGGCCGCCGGGYGGCYGGGWGGCYGGGWGGCYGGGWGGCYGGGGWGGCYGGGGWGGGAPVMMGGCYGGGVIMGGGVITGGVITGGGTKDGTKKDGKGGKKEGGNDEETLLTPGTAQVVIVVSLPAEAKLFIDDKATRSTGPTRVFVSPTLEGGRSYTYELKGEMKQEGRTRNVSKSVKVEPGRTTYVNLTFPTREVAQGNP
jgi:uncharacterized protein (TIGR03000 family)